ncbi:YggS family pyridoxal phosphate-dependent enzyme [Haematomicrobium sanguinis]|uniref:YggS family pyridoxal phosphate-dependent enzyme n=1 Tax=Haematomicrobium sanguinis TaxID=479106 RepID=UPI00047CFB02|nr:YggS family pyridoxal phosphate-dependent enzyme [Haematomicrobium sanguinis]
MTNSSDNGAAPHRVEELRANLLRVRKHIKDVTPAGQAQPKLIVVTKFFPASDVRALHGLGVQDIGENKEQEARVKHAEVVDLTALRWHFIGQLQRNKAKSVARFAHSVHSVDRVSLAEALAKAVLTENEQREAGGQPRREPLQAYIQLDLREGAQADEPGRGGAKPEDMLTLADAIAGQEGLDLVGLMAVAPLGEDPNRAFERLHRYSAELQREHPGASFVSAGMSQDMQAAIENGATHLRIGSDILGSRPPVR